MGCDIHFYVERRVDGVWQTADEWEQDPYDEDPGHLTVDYEKSFYHDRNYDLFSILADVRNGHGFAGVKTSEGFIPMFAPRGVPDDACPEYKAAATGYGSDGHSHSWVTLAEILAYDWTERTLKQGWVGPQEWARARDNGGKGPEGWSGMISGGAVRHLTSEEFEAAWQQVRAELVIPEHYKAYALVQDWREEHKAALSRMVELLGGGTPVCLVTWTIPYYHAGRTFLSEVVSRLLRLGAHDDVRCCFFFDN